MKSLPSSTHPPPSPVQMIRAMYTSAATSSPLPLTLRPPPPLLLRSKPTLHFPSSIGFTLNTKHNHRLALLPSPPCRIAASASAADSEIDLVMNKQGIYAPKQTNKVVVLWDLDNKPPRGPPFPAAMALKQLAQGFGELIDISAYANRHAFSHLPQWVVQERRERKHLAVLERKGAVSPAEPYVCGVCGRKCKTNLDLKKHFKQLHERERQKKLNRMKSLKGKKRQRYKERFISGNHKYNEEARRLLTPNVGYGLAAELRRAGVYVKTVEDKPQAADWALKRQIEHSMTRGVDWLFLVSDDSDFKEVLRKAREANLGTVVVGDWDGALGRDADVWVPWIGVENGEVTEKDLVPRSTAGRRGDDDLEWGDGSFTVTHFDGDFGNLGSDLESFVDETLAMRSEFNGVKISIFSEGEEEEEEEEEEGDYLVWDSEDEDY